VKEKSGRVLQRLLMTWSKKYTGVVHVLSKNVISHRSGIKKDVLLNPSTDVTCKSAVIVYCQVTAAAIIERLPYTDWGLFQVYSAPESRIILPSHREYARLHAST